MNIYVYSDESGVFDKVHYVYKISVKRAFEQLILNKQIIPNEIENIYFFVDEHTTATNGRYELREGIEQELKNGTHNFEYNTYYPPIFPNVRSIDMKFCNSESTLLVRAADIVANRVFYLQRNDLIKLNAINDINLIYFPWKFVKPLVSKVYKRM